VSTFSGEDQIPIVIKGTGYYVPERIITNEYYKEQYGYSEEWIYRVTGITERRRSTDTQFPSDLAVEAANKALTAANMTPDDLDMILFASMAGDYTAPPTSCLIQDRLKATNASTFDICGSCTGFVRAFHVGSLYIQNGYAKNVLVVSAETTFKGANVNDKDTIILLGDGAGAAILSKSDDESGIIAFESGSDGTKWQAATILGGSTRHLNFSEDEYYFSMKGRDIYRLAVLHLPNAILKALQKCNLSIDDVDIIVPHQANMRILDSIAHRLEVDKSKFFVNLYKYGNTASASISIALAEAVEQDRIHKNDIVVLATFGAGFSWAVTVLRW
jgi:3-oxoacyl-[acyl-carrier-protein] synthase-3